MRPAQPDAAAQSDMFRETLEAIHLIDPVIDQMPAPDNGSAPCPPPLGRTPAQ